MAAAGPSGRSLDSLIHQLRCVADVLSRQSVLAVEFQGIAGFGEISDVDAPDAAPG